MDNIHVDNKVDNITSINNVSKQDKINNYIKEKKCTRETIKTILQCLVKIKQQTNIGFFKKCFFYLKYNVLKCDCKNNIFEICLYWNLVNNHYNINGSYLYKLQDIQFYLQIAYERRRLNNRICFYIKNVLSDYAINRLLNSNIVIIKILNNYRPSIISDICFIFF